MSELYLVTSGACLIAALQWSAWALSVKSSTFQWTIATMALAFAGIQGASYVLFSTAVFETARFSISLLTYCALIAFPLFIKFVSLLVRLPKPHHAAWAFGMASLILILANVLTPYAIPFERVTAIMRSDLIVNPEPLQGPVNIFAIMLPIYYFMGFGWLSRCIFSLWKSSRSGNVILLASFLAIMILGYVWDAGIAFGLFKGLPLGGTPFVVLMLLISIVESRRLKAALDSRDSLYRNWKQEQQNYLRLDADYRALAFKDQITGLANRPAFLEGLEYFLHTEQAHTHPYLFFISINEFKAINMLYGYPVGDELLRQVGQRLEQAPDRNEAVARVSDDTFAVLIDVNGVLPSGINSLNRDSWQDSAGITRPYSIMGSLLHVSFNIGVVPIDKKNKELSAHDYLLQAEVALHRAQKNKEANLVVYDEQLRHELDRESLLSQGLKTAIAKDQMRLVYQPQYDHHDDLIGAEALLRWQHPEHGNVSPELFVPLAESGGLVRQIDYWVMDQALSAMRHWLDKNMAPPIISINVSAITLYADETIAYVASTLKKHRIDAGSVQLEVTETALMQDLDTCIKVLQGLRQMGIRIAIDDFGTGYSSLSYLGNLPADTLKIDKAFTQQILSFQGRKLVGAIINIGLALNMDVMAEGVETRQQRYELADLKCQKYQGFLFSKPLAVDDFESLLGENSHPPKKFSLDV